MTLIRESFNRLDANRGSLKKNYKFDKKDVEQVSIANQSVAVREEFNKRAIKPAPMAKINTASVRMKIN